MSIFADPLERLSRNLYGPIDASVDLSSHLVANRDRIWTCLTVEDDVDIRRLVLKMDELDAIHDCDVSSGGEEHANCPNHHSTTSSQINFLIVLQMLLSSSQTALFFIFHCTLLVLLCGQKRKAPEWGLPLGVDRGVADGLVGADLLLALTDALLVTTLRMN